VPHERVIPHPQPGAASVSVNGTDRDRRLRGSSKSHLARVLGARLGIMPVHLDAAYYDKDWKPLEVPQCVGKAQSRASSNHVVVRPPPRQ
jgi:hypothetical protein